MRSNCLPSRCKLAVREAWCCRAGGGNGRLTSASHWLGIAMNTRHLCWPLHLHRLRMQLLSEGIILVAAILAITRRKTPRSACVKESSFCPSPRPYILHFSKAPHPVPCSVDAPHTAFYIMLPSAGCSKGSLRCTWISNFNWRVYSV